MYKKNIKFGSYFLITIILTLGLSISFQNLLAVWTPPTEDPAGGNVAEPINESDLPQVKQGTLWLGGDNYTANSGNWGLLVEQGNVGIGTINPTVKLDVVGDLNVSGTITGSIPWSSLSDIPADFADGVDDTGAGDNLGNHTLIQNLILGTNYISGDGGNEGVRVDTNGDVRIPGRLIVEGGVFYDEPTPVQILTLRRCRGFSSCLSTTNYINNGSVAAHGAMVYSSSLGDWLPNPTQTETLTLKVNGAETYNMADSAYLSYVLIYRINGNGSVKIFTETGGYQHYISVYGPAGDFTAISQTDTFQRQSDTVFQVNGTPYTINIGSYATIVTQDWRPGDDGTARSYIRLYNSNASYYQVYIFAYEYDEQADSATIKINSSATPLSAYSKD